MSVASNWAAIQIIMARSKRTHILQSHTQKALDELARAHCCGTKDAFFLALSKCVPLGQEHDVKFCMEPSPPHVLIKLTVRKETRIFGSYDPDRGEITYM